MSELNYNPITEYLNLILFAQKSGNGEKVLPKDDDITKVISYLDSIDSFSMDREELCKERVVDANKAFFRDCFRLRDVPIYRDDLIFDGSPFIIKLKPVHGDNVGKLTFNKTKGKACEQILLSEDFIKRSIGIYAHEITHTQLEFDPSHYYNNYFHKEVLSIFIEKLIMYEINTEYYNDIKSMRLLMLKDMLNRYSTYVWNRSSDSIILDGKALEYDARAYIISTFIANNLFYKYMNGSLEKKGKMINGIQSIFDSKKTVEEFMSDYSVSYENSKQLKYIK